MDDNQIQLEAEKVAFEVVGWHPEEHYIKAMMVFAEKRNTWLHMKAIKDKTESYKQLHQLQKRVEEAWEDGFQTGLSHPEDYLINKTEFMTKKAT